MSSTYIDLFAQHQKIQFTTETEQTNNLPFLDAMIQQNDGKLEFNVYRKSTSTTRYITGDSYHPTSKKNVLPSSISDNRMAIQLEKYSELYLNMNEKPQYKI
jgi:hypothetical protein